MKKPSFLSKLKAEDRLKLVEPSEDICNSYIEKADNCLKSAKILLQNNLYENSTGMSYYTMYNSLTALLFRNGIKCENHAGSILLLKKLFGKPNLFKVISSAKEERIDKQYSVVSKKNTVLIEDSAKGMVKEAEDFLVKMKLIISEIKNEEIENMRMAFRKLE